MYIGTYNAPLLMGTGEIYQGDGKGIHCLNFDPENGTLLPSGSPVPADNTSFLSMSSLLKTAQSAHFRWMRTESPYI